MAKIEVVGFGAMNIDHLCQVKELVVDGEQAVTGFESIPGGSAANTIYGLAKLGVITGFVGAVGTDKSGKLLMDDFKTVNVNTSQISFKKAETVSVGLHLDKHYNLVPDKVRITVRSGISSNTWIETLFAFRWLMVPVVMVGLMVLFRR